MDDLCTKCGSITTHGDGYGQPADHPDCLKALAAQVRQLTTYLASPTEYRRLLERAVELATGECTGCGYPIGGDDECPTCEWYNESKRTIGR